MDLETIFQRFNPWWTEPFSSPGIIRNQALQLLLQQAEQKEITFVTGLRRVGKTTLLRQTIAKLLQQGIDKHRIFFLSMDHSALNSISIRELVEKFRETQGLSVREQIFLFLDEIQYHDHFEADLKILHDHEKVKIFASGSNSLILKDRKAFLTGRNRKIVINPLSFEEYLFFQGISILPVDRQLVEKQIQGYLEYGGMPEYVLSHDPEKILFLIKDIIYKDIVGKHGIKNPKKIEELLLLLCERVGKRLTYNKLAHILGIDAETVSAYVSYFEETFLLYQVSRYATSLNEVVRSPKKIYIADQGLRNVLTGFRDKGALWENLVFLQIKECPVTYFYENGREIDFIIKIPKQKREIAVEAKFKEIVDKQELKTLQESSFKEKIVVKDWNDLQKLKKMIA